MSITPSTSGDAEDAAGIGVAQQATALLDGIPDGGLPARQPGDGLIGKPAVDVDAGSAKTGRRVRRSANAASGTGPQAVLSDVA